MDIKSLLGLSVSDIDIGLKIQASYKAND